MDRRKERIRILARLAIALMGTGLTEDQIKIWLAALATQLWTPSPDILRSYVNAAWDEATVYIKARRKNLYTWIPDYSATEP